MDIYLLCFLKTFLHSKTNKIFIKECFVFKIICDLTGKCFDPDGKYCIDKKQLNHALIRSALPRSVLEKNKIDFKILEVIIMRIKIYFNIF